VTEDDPQQRSRNYCDFFCTSSGGAGVVVSSRIAAITYATNTTLAVPAASAAATVDWPFCESATTRPTREKEHTNKDRSERDVVDAQGPAQHSNSEKEELCQDVAVEA
jgi:hypothetical protein